MNSKKFVPLDVQPVSYTIETVPHDVIVVSDDEDEDVVEDISDSSEDEKKKENGNLKNQIENEVLLEQLKKEFETDMADPVFRSSFLNQEPNPNQVPPVIVIQNPRPQIIIVQQQQETAHLPPVASEARKQERKRISKKKRNKHRFWLRSQQKKWKKLFKH